MIPVPLTKLCPWRKTAESRTGSLPSAMASFMWLVTPGTTSAEHVSTVVKPSICVFNVGGTLLTKNCGLCGVVSPPASLPSLIELTSTGSVVPGTSAQLVPFTKKPNTSLNSVLAKSLYSSEEKT